MVRRFLLVSILCGSVTLFAQKGGGSAGGGGIGSAGSTGGTSGGTTATSGPAGTPGTTAPGGIPTTAGTVGGLSGQAASGPINSPSGNTGIPTVQQTMGGPAGTTGTNQGDINNLNSPTIAPGGFITGGGTTGGVLLSTPFVSFPSPVPTAGISDAGRAGISSNTSLGGGMQGAGGTAFSNGVIINAAALNGSGRLITDVGPSEFIGAVNQGAPAPSLAEAAAHFKSQQNSQNARTLTNADVQRLIGSNTNAQPTTVASNMPPSGMPAPAQTAGTPQSTTSSASTSSAAPGQQQNAPAQTSTSNQTGAGAQSTQNASSSTTPQINQGQSGSNENSHLPATSTILPLLGLLGVASSGVGLWYRKHRK